MILLVDLDEGVEEGIKGANVGSASEDIGYVAEVVESFVAHGGSDTVPDAVVLRDPTTERRRGRAEKRVGLSSAMISSPGWGHIAFISLPAFGIFVFKMEREEVG
ncbi:hypothetical protein ACLOJK_008093 [Asimina triloba]